MPIKIRSVDAGEFQGFVLVDENGNPFNQTNKLPVEPQQKTVMQTNRSGTITTGGQSQLLMAANANRRSYWLQNQSSDSLWINHFGNAATTGQPNMEIRSGGYFETPSNGSGTSAVYIYGATTGQAFACGECE